MRKYIKIIIIQGKREKGLNKGVSAFGRGDDDFSSVYWDNFKKKWQGAESSVSWGVKTLWGVKEAESA